MTRGVRNAGPPDHRRRTRGQALLEFAIVVPVFLVMLFAIVDFGRVVWANNSLAGAAREAARFAIVHGGSTSTACPVGPRELDAVLVVASSACPFPAPSKEAIRNVVKSFAKAGGTGLIVQVCYGTGCTGDTDAVISGQPSTNVRGTPVTVTVTSSVDLVTGGLLGRSRFTVSGNATMIVNH